MVLHLEAGTCESGVDNDWVAQVAFECHASQSFTSDDDGYDFMCPTCQTPFLYVSGVLQHVESDCCDENFGGGKPLWRFLHFVRSQF